METMDVVEYKCPNCTADLKFTPQTQRLSCDYCGSTFTVGEIRQLFAKNEQDADAGAGTDAADETDAAGEDGGEFAESTRLYHCASCGADIMATAQQAALFCYYCHNPVILSGKLTGKYRPQKVIGFKISREQAVGIFKKWCFKSFVPRDFKTEQQLEKITGLYVPFWIADCQVDASYSAVGKKIRSWHSGDYDYTETKEYAVVRKASVFARGVPADGSKKIDDGLMESIEPFDYNELADFSMSYLSGFYADKYDMGRSAMLPRIQERVKAACGRLLSASVGGYDSIGSKKEGCSFNNVDVQYAMLPVWFMSYRYNDKVYEFVLNGQTGKVAGTPPLAEKRLVWCCRGVFVACAVLVYLVVGAVIGGIF